MNINQFSVLFLFKFQCTILVVPIKYPAKLSSLNFVFARYLWFETIISHLSYSYLLYKKVVTIDHVNHKRQWIFQFFFDKVVKCSIFVPPRRVYDGDP